MIILYNVGTQYKVDKELGTSRCENCGHITQIYLLREIFVFKLFYIPIIHKVKRRGKMCAHCGRMERLNSQDYKSLK